MTEDSKDKWLDAAELQIMEWETLQSMYPGPQELSLENPMSMAERNSYVESQTERNRVVSRLEYSINLNISEIPYSIEFTLPPLYPFVPCEAVVRCNLLSKSVLLDLNTKLKQQISEVDLGELCVITLMSWFTEIASEIQDKDEDNCEGGSSKKPDLKDVFCRMWIYSHHIYSKTKRKDLLDLSVEYDITGFTLPGKPGLICVEGWKNNLTAWWSIVRSWNWQKILIKRQETEEVGSLEDFQSFRRFKDYQELNSSDIRVKGGGYHVDMGDLYKFLQKHDSEYMFEEYFGLKGGGQK